MKPNYSVNCTLKAKTFLKRLAPAETFLLSTPVFLVRVLSCAEGEVSIGRISNRARNPGAMDACTPSELKNILLFASDDFQAYPDDPYNEVYPNIYLGDSPTALNKQLLKRLGITHVLNAAQGKEADLYLINTTEDYYRDVGIEFFGIRAFDLTSFKLDEHFNSAADFIKKALTSDGKVLVHCRQGISRSAALVLAYLMIEEGMTAQDATRTVRAVRFIFPNEGFLKQLCDLNETIIASKK